MSTQPVASPGRAGRPVVVHAFVTLDGYMVGPDEDVSWVAQGFDPAMQNDIAIDMQQGTDCFVFGRVTYEMFAAYWPNAVPYAPGDGVKPSEGKEDPRIIETLNASPKLVFSRTLTEATWRGTRIASGGPEEEVRKLRSAPGKGINVQGSASIVQALQRADLVDAYQLYVHPVLLGQGKLLFAGNARQDFERVQLTPYPNGVIAVRYARKRADA